MVFLAFFATFHQRRPCSTFFELAGFFKGNAGHPGNVLQFIDDRGNERNAVLTVQRFGFAFRVAQFLWYFRLIGVVAFEFTGLRAMLLIFPNTFEYFFIFYEVLRQIRLVELDEFEVRPARDVSDTVDVWYEVRFLVVPWLFVLDEPGQPI